MNPRNPVLRKNGTIDIEIHTTRFGWTAFTASPDDCEAHGRELHRLALAGEYGPLQKETDE